VTRKTHDGPKTPHGAAIRHAAPLAAEQLRRRAESRLRRHGARADLPGTQTEARKLLHELQVHQIELELQNEELSQARARAEALLKRYADLYDFAPTGYATIGRDGTIRQINLTAASLLGIERSRLVGRRLDLSLAPSSQPVFAAFLKKTFASAGPESCEAVLLGSRTAPRFVRITAGAARGAEECRIAMEDITDRRLAEQAASRANAEWQRTFDTVPDLIAIIDNRQRITRVNKALADRLGVPPEQCVGRPCHEVLHGLDQPPPYCPHALTCADGKEHAVETHEARLMGDFSISVSSIKDERGAVVGCVHVARDVTESKRAQTQLQEAGKMRSGLISLINHEYANALTNMKLALTLIQGEETTPPDGARSHACEVLERSIENLRGYTTNFLNLHRLESGKFELNLRPTTVRDVVSNALVSLRPLAQAKELRISLQTGFPDGPPAAVRADPECLSVIINNLVTNAIKYTSPGGAVTVSVDPEGKPASEILVSVQDNGIGISKDELERIKSGFYRTPKSRGLARGFGVGLMIVNQLLEKHGSRLDIASEPGKGSRFSFRLPIWQEN